MHRGLEGEHSHEKQSAGSGSSSRPTSPAGRAFVKGILLAYRFLLDVRFDTFIVFSSSAALASSERRCLRVRNFVFWPGSVLALILVTQNLPTA